MSDEVTLVHPVTGATKRVEPDRAVVLRERGWVGTDAPQRKSTEKPDKPDIEAGRAKLDAEAGRVKHVEPVSQRKPFRAGPKPASTGKSSE